MKYFLSILIMVGLFIGCNKLDKPTEYMADKILASDSFDFCTYQPSCLGANEIVLRKTSTSKPLLTVFVEEKEINLIELTTDKVKELLKEGFNPKPPLDTGPGNMNRYYLLASATDTILFYNNDENIYDMFLRLAKIEDGSSAALSKSGG